MKDRGLAEENLRRIYRYMEFIRKRPPEGGGLQEKLKEYPEWVRFVRIVVPGDTVFHEGDVVSLEAFVKENERVEKFGGRKAIAGIGGIDISPHSPWLTPEQRRELVKEFGHAAVAWAEAVTAPGDMEGVRRAAEHWKRRLREVLGI